MRNIKFENMKGKISITTLIKLSLFIFVIFNTNLALAYQEETNTEVNTNDTLQNSSKEDIIFDPGSENVVKAVTQLEPRYYVGAGLGLTTGSGISFGMDRAYEGFSGEATAFLLKSNSLSIYSFGARIKYALIDNEKRHLYLNYGLSYNYWSVNKNDNKLSSPFRTGLGLGYMQFFSNNFSYDVSILATYFTGDGSIYPVPQVGIQYHFRE